MKKNRMMRLASGLLVLTLLTTSIISGTFAKYVTEETAGETARVAKWGVVVTASGNLFGDAYENGTTGENKNEVTTSGTNGATVQSKNYAKVVAPGTKSATTPDATDGLLFTVTGTPEVATTISATCDQLEEVTLNAGTYLTLVKANNEVTATNIEGYYLKNDNGTYTQLDNKAQYNANSKYYKMINTVTIAPDSSYKPIQWYLDGEKKTADEIATAYKTEKTISANTDLSAALDKNFNHRIGFEWDFDDTGKGTHDKEDTILGNLAAIELNNSQSEAKELDFVVVKAPESGTTYTIPEEGMGKDYNLSVCLGLTVTVTQVD